jgi:tetratricopeptide (TPR) repeat protein
MRRKNAAGIRFDASDYSYRGDNLKKHWAALHKGDREPYPSEQAVARLAKAHPAAARGVTRQGGAGAVAGKLQEAWRNFHRGDFVGAIETASELEAIGAAAANKAVAIHTLYLEVNERQRLDLLEAAIQRGEGAVAQLPDWANAQYTLGLVLGRYSQRISILEALASGFAGKVHACLRRTLELEPRHAEAHIAIGLYHAEIVSKLGGLAARLTYGASQDAAIEHFRHAIKLMPKSAIAHVEYAHGLLLLDADGHRHEVEKLCAHAAACKPLDVMEHLDVERAKHHCTQLD